MQISIPDYLLKQLLNHYETLLKNGSFDRSNVKVANAVRVGSREIEKIRKIIKKQSNENND